MYPPPTNSWSIELDNNSQRIASMTCTGASDRYHHRYISNAPHPATVQRLVGAGAILPRGPASSHDHPALRPPPLRRGEMAYRRLSRRPAESREKIADIARGIRIFLSAKRLAQCAQFRWYFFEWTTVMRC